MDSVFENNILLTQTERLMMLGRSKQPNYARNKNILVIDGSGKTRFFVKLNLMHSSMLSLTQTDKYNKGIGKHTLNERRLHTIKKQAEKDKRTALYERLFQVKLSHKSSIIAHTDNT